LVDRVRSDEEGATGREEFRVDDDGTVLDPRIVARATRLLRWYPHDWRERYGEEFVAVVTSSLGDGQGGHRLSFDVAREGVVARFESAGFVGRSAPAQERARGSIMSVFVAFFGFLTSAAVLLFYSKGWQRTPVIEPLDNAVTVLSRSKAARLASEMMKSPLHRKLQLAATRSPNGNSAAWKALYKFQTKAMNEVSNSAAGRAFHQVVRGLHPASGAPVVFENIAFYVAGAAIVCIAIALIYLVATTVRTQWRHNRRRLLVPIGLLVASAVSGILAVIAYHAFEQIPPGGPTAWMSLTMFGHGRFQYWAPVVLPLCVALSIVLAMIGGSKMLRRVEYASRLYRVQSSLAISVASCLAIVIVSTIMWVATLTVQAPDFLVAKDGGPFGTAFLPLFLVAILAMIGTSWIVVSRSAQCLRSIRSD
jgi:hypothetical protein